MKHYPSGLMREVYEDIRTQVYTEIIKVISDAGDYEDLIRKLVKARDE